MIDYGKILPAGNKILNTNLVTGNSGITWNNSQPRDQVQIKLLK